MKRYEIIIETIEPNPKDVIQYKMRLDGVNEKDAINKIDVMFPCRVHDIKEVS